MAKQPSVPVVLHYPDINSAPAGVWWWDGSSSLSKFYIGNTPLETVGDAVMSSVAARPDLIEDVAEFFESLEERSPRPSVWTAATAKAMSPIEYLQFVRKQIAATK